MQQQSSRRLYVPTAVALCAVATAAIVFVIVIWLPEREVWKREHEAITSIRQRWPCVAVVDDKAGWIGLHRASEVDCSQCGKNVKHVDDLIALIATLQKTSALNLSSLPLEAKHVKEIVQMPLIQSLSLRETGIDDAAIDGLSAISGLQHLDLSGNPIGDRAFESLARLPSLRELSLVDTRVTRAKALEFKNRRRNCIVVIGSSAAAEEI